MAAYFEDPTHLAYEETAQTSAAYFEDFAHLAIQKPRHLEQREPPIFENLKSIFLCPCPDFNGGVGSYRTKINVCVHQTPVRRTQF